MILVYFVIVLLVTKSTDGPLEQIYLPGKAGFIVAHWGPNAIPSNPSKPNLIFNHFVNKDGLLFSTHYQDNYDTPILQLSVGRVHHIRSQPYYFKRGVYYELWAFWRQVNGMIEMGVYVDGKMIGYLWEPLKPYKSWVGGTYIGTRGPEPVSDPGFPGVCHADGELSVWIWVKHND